MSKLARITVIVTLAAGIAFLGLLSGGTHQGARAVDEPDPMRGHYPVSMPRYPGVKEYPLGSDLKVGDSPMKMSYFSTEDEPLQVARFYASRWKAAGHHVTEDITLQGGVVAAYDPASGALRQVLIRRKGRKSTVFPSVIAKPLQPKRVTAEKQDDVPVYPGSEGTLTFGGRDPGHRSRVTMFTNYGGVLNNVQFYRGKLAERGWREVPSKGGSPLPPEVSETLTFHKGSRELTINITRVDDEKHVRVHITEAQGQELGLTPPPTTPATPPQYGGTR